MADYETGLGTVASAGPAEPGPRLLSFVGSTVGGFDTDERLAFHRTLARTLSGDDHLLLGADLVKSPDLLVRAYDDPTGVSAAFNRNVLHVLNRELGADFDPDAFDHVAFWQTESERMVMSLRARTPQTVGISGLGLSLDLAAGENIRTQLAHKFRRDTLTAELHDCGLTVRH